ncbi:hypothetical protein TWF718_009811 [Orbilia javanica]|uniref:Uncharacterized protein n=1 Tax=Orbilia javanica TaxID=47235 RepID=A0AAN8MU15_9PEZI
MKKFILPILLILSAINANPITWVLCPPTTDELDTQWPASPSVLTYNMRSLLKLLSEKDFMKEIHTRLLPHKMRLEYDLIRRWERGRGIPHPYPMDSLRTLYWFITENRLHCHPNTLSLASVFSRVIEIESEAWNFGNNQGGGNNGVGAGDQPGQQQALGLASEDIEDLDTEYSLDREVDPNFQYVTYSPIKHLSILVHIHTDELEQYFDYLVDSGEVEQTPMLYFELHQQMKEWSKLYYELDAFMNGTRAFRKSLWMLREREARPEELKRLAQGKPIAKPQSIPKKIASCLNRLCNPNQGVRPNLNT